MSASLSIVAAIAIRCSSPPDNWEMSRSRNESSSREAEETKGVLAVLMDEVFLQRLGQSDDSDCVERTFTRANSARDAGLFADSSLPAFRIDPDDFRAGPLRRAEGDALEVAALGLTPVLEDHSDAHGGFHVAGD